jgi:hypothetical protein
MEAPHCVNPVLLLPGCLLPWSHSFTFEPGMLPCTPHDITTRVSKYHLRATLPTIYTYNRYTTVADTRYRSRLTTISRLLLHTNMCIWSTNGHETQKLKLVRKLNAAATRSLTYHCSAAVERSTIKPLVCCTATTPSRSLAPGLTTSTLLTSPAVQVPRLVTPPSD